jgi:hypothetical protein
VKAIDAGVALGCVQVRSGIPFRLSDSSGATHLVLHLQGESFEFALRGEWWQVSSRAEALLLLDDLRGNVRLEPVDAVEYVLEVA